MRLNINIFTSCDLLVQYFYLTFFIIKAWKWTEEIRPKRHDDVDMKFGPVTKPDKRNKITWKKFDDDIMLASRDAIVIFRFIANFEQSGTRIQDRFSLWNLHFR